IIAAFLYAQLENIEDIQDKRKSLWNLYHEKLSVLQDKGVKLPFIPEYATNNAHMFYLVCNSIEERSALIQHLKNENILSVFHYLSLHKSPYYTSQYEGPELEFT